MSFPLPSCQCPTRPTQTGSDTCPRPGLIYGPGCLTSKQSRAPSCAQQSVPGCAATEHRPQPHTPLPRGPQSSSVFAHGHGPELAMPPSFLGEWPFPDPPPGVIPLLRGHSPSISPHPSSCPPSTVLSPVGQCPTCFFFLGVKRWEPAGTGCG